jgi:hypothetical protein
MLQWTRNFSVVNLSFAGATDRHPLKRRSAAARLLGLWVRIPPVAWMSIFVSVVFCQVEVSATS